MKLYVISHKTRRPILGSEYDLHAAARGFLVAQNLMESGGLPPENVFFALTKEEKAARIAELHCQVFIDDLPEILAMPGLPTDLRAILFDPDELYSNQQRFERYVSWRDIAAALLGTRT